MRLLLKVNLSAALLALASVSASSTELAILKNGSAIRHERHEQRSEVTRLYLSETTSCYVDVQTDEIVRFEEVEQAAGLTTPPFEAKSGAPPTASAPSLEPAGSLDVVIRAAGGRNRIDPDLITSIIRAESGFDAKAVSPKGAKGLMQLMPETATHLGVENAMDPTANVEGGTRYLVELLARYDDDLIKALAAYNAGPKRVGQYHGVPPYSETRAYITKVVGDFNRRKLTQRRVKADSLGKPEGPQDPGSKAPALPPQSSRPQESSTPQ